MLCRDVTPQPTAGSFVSCTGTYYIEFQQAPAAAHWGHLPCSGSHFSSNHSSSSQASDFSYTSRCVACFEICAASQTELLYRWQPLLLRGGCRGCSTSSGGAAVRKKKSMICLALPVLQVLGLWTLKQSLHSSPSQVSSPHQPALAGRQWVLHAYHLLHVCPCVYHLDFVHVLALALGSYKLQLLQHSGYVAAPILAWTTCTVCTMH